MKRLLFLFLTLTIILSSCSFLGGQSNGSLEIAGQGVSLSAPKGWETAESEDFDLALTNAEGSMTFGLSCYERYMLESRTSSEDFFKDQGEIYLRGYSQITDISKTAVETLDDRTVYSRICSATKDGKTDTFYFGMTECDDRLIFGVGKGEEAAIRAEETALRSLLGNMAVENEFEIVHQKETVTRIHPECYYFPYHRIRFSTTRDIWWENMHDSQYALRLRSHDEKVMLYIKLCHRSELPEVKAPGELFKELNEEILGEYDKRTITHEYLVGVYRGSQRYSISYLTNRGDEITTYHSTLIDLADSDWLVWVCFAGDPQILESDYNEFGKIVDTFSVVECP